MKTITTPNKQSTLNLAQSVARRSNLPLPKLEDVIEVSENEFKIELDLDSIEHLPIGLKKVLK